MQRRFALALVLCVPVVAQDSAGRISGRVTDPTGAAVAAAKLVATHAETGAARETASDADGAYVFPDLPIGPYRITTSRAGFKKSVRSGIELHVSEHVSVPVTLEVGDLAQEVSVVADPDIVQTESSEQGGLISGDQVRELQLNGRSFMTLLELLPGVASDMPDRADPNSNPTMSINGARSSASNFNIDGGNNADIIVGSSSLNTFTSVETIAEIKVLTSTFSAEYGRGGFSQVNVVTRGGTKQFHGSLYHFFRNDALDATDYFSHQVLPLKLNNFGYTLGGPIAFKNYNRDRSRTFFFFTQEFNIISTRGAAVNTTVPTEAERRGDFRALGAGNDRAFGTADDPVIDSDTRAGFPGGIIPASRIDPNGAKLVALYPLPNFVGPGVINYTSAAPSRQNWREELIRIDHAFTPANRFYVRYAQDTAYVRNPYGGSGITSITTRFPGIGTTQSDRPGKNMVANFTSAPSARFLNQIHFTFARRYFDMRAVTPNANRKTLGITVTELFPENEGDIIPQITLTPNYGAINVPRKGHKELFNLEFADNVTRIAGKHVLKAGVLYSYAGNLEQPFSPNTSGTLTFNTQLARHPVANLLLGLPFSYTEVERTVWSDARFGMLEAFVQDDFKASRRLTFNIGLRYSDYYNPYDRNNVLSNFLPGAFDPARAQQLNRTSGQLILGTGDPLNGIILAGKNSPFGKNVTNNNLHLWGPRFGFAWAPARRGRMSIRGGYGLYYTRPLIGTFINNAFDNPPFSRSVTIQTPLLANPGGGAEAANVTPVNLTALGVPLPAPTIQQWSASVQRELARRTVLEVAYVATRGTHLQRPLNINSPEPGAFTAQRVNVNAVRPFIGYGNITVRQTTATSSYHSMQVKFDRRVSTRLSTGVAYTWGKSIDDGSSERGGSDVPPNSRDIRSERGPSDLDRTHILTTNFIWRIPGLAAGARPIRTFTRGWEFSGISRMWAGLPFDATLSADVAGIGTTQNQRPNVIADTGGPRTTEEWFNRNAFARPASGTFGNMGRNSLRRPGVHKWDLALYKNFAVDEKRKLQFRAELFNAANHPSFSAVGAALNTTGTSVNPNINNFAVITDTRDARVVQFALKLSF